LNEKSGQKTLGDKSDPTAHTLSLIKDKTKK